MRPRTAGAVAACRAHRDSVLSVGIAQGQPAPAPPARPSPRASVPVPCRSRVTALRPDRPGAAVGRTRLPARRRRQDPRGCALRRRLPASAVHQGQLPLQRRRPRRARLPLPAADAGACPLARGPGLVHGGVHGNWSIGMFPFVKEAVARGYIVIAPEYRGSTGYGKAHHMAIDYGGYEVDDVLTAVDYLKTLAPVDLRASASWAGATAATSPCCRSSATRTRSRRRWPWCRSRTWCSASEQGAQLPVGLRHAGAHRRPALREARDLHRTVAPVSRRQAAGAAARPRRDE